MWFIVLFFEEHLLQHIKNVKRSCDSITEFTALLFDKCKLHVFDSNTSTDARVSNFHDQFEVVTTI